MTPVVAAELLSLLQVQALTLEEIHNRAGAAGSAWTLDQVRLFLRCLPDVSLEPSTGRYRNQGSGDGALRAAILDAARSFKGRPVPASEVRSRLPDGFLTTDEQVRAIAKQTPGLEVLGPGLIRSR